ncbi:YfcC family protein [Aeromicrobium chenweiae]|uniref:C4-dicarboxylate ABC transporter n=1 Tax=Aeromicrobium chenweiae TaxID=2079793 RepID=A0A2S0WLW8_9ACTN|nr:YfcC family protein [Aeromicrobium chenweiae]AWB92338.1 C4-dicarboxylate ABC transporter [Aeromicrobium chenweiae]TGN31375.1 YfcC family protein [Aeromicrobium chenweiae]
MAATHKRPSGTPDDDSPTAPADPAGAGGPADPGGGTDSTAEEGTGKTLRFPSAFTVLFGVTVAVWLLAFVIPTGSYKTEDGRPVPGSYERTDAGLSFIDRLMQLFLAPVNGLYGILNDKGFIGPNETGELYGAAGVFLFVLAIGIFITMAMATGAIDNGVARVAQRMSSRGAVLIAVLMVLFSIGGTVEGMAEETLGFYALVVPLMLALGYDRLVAAALIMVGAGIGTLASTVNPFATGVASGAADISIGDGIVERFIMYVVLVPIGVWWVLRYARKVKADPSASLVGPAEGDEETRAHGLRDVDPLTGREKTVLAVVGVTFVFMIFAIVPWAQIIDGPDAASYSWQLDWYFPELAALFLTMSIVVGLIGGLGEKRLTDTLVSGAGDFIGVGLIIVLARGVTAIMNNSEITDTILHSMENIVSDTSSGVFGAVMLLINLPLAFLVPSSSGHAALAMPILAPLADFAGVERAMVVTAYQSASGLVNLITPTSAVVMGGLALAKVRYDQYLRFVMPLVGILLVMSLIFVVIGSL